MELENKNSVELQQYIERAAAIDIHRDILVVSIGGISLELQTRNFNSFTEDLDLMIDWFKENQISHVVMESTSKLWLPIFEKIEQNKMKAILVNPRKIRVIPGHKTDKNDSQWLCKLLLKGLCNVSFIPDEDIRHLRDLVKMKDIFSKERSKTMNRINDILKSANIKLSSVMDDIFCVSGMKIIKAIIEGESNPDKLLQFCHKRLKTPKEILRKSLIGNIDEHDRYLLKIYWEEIESKNTRIEEITQKISKNAEKYTEEIELLDSITGIGEESAIKIISVIGVDTEQFPTVKHLTSWAGLCPSNHESAGKRKNTRIGIGNKVIKETLVQCAWSAVRAKNSYLKLKYFRLRKRLGKKKAIIAIAHTLLRACYSVLKNKQKYQDLGERYNPSKQIVAA